MFDEQTGIAQGAVSSQYYLIEGGGKKLGDQNP